MLILGIAKSLPSPLLLPDENIFAGSSTSLRLRRLVQSRRNTNNNTNRSGFSSQIIFFHFDYFIPNAMKVRFSCQIFPEKFIRLSSISREMQFNIHSFFKRTDRSISSSKHCKFILLIKEKEKIKLERVINVYFSQNNEKYTDKIITSVS